MKLIETQSKWGNLYRRSHFMNGRKVSETDFSRALVSFNAFGKGVYENTAYGFRTVWEL